MWQRVRALEASARADLVKQGFRTEDVSCQAYLNLRFQGTDTALMTPTSVPRPPAAQAPEPGQEEAVGVGEGSSGGSDALASFFGQYR